MKRIVMRICLAWIGAAVLAAGAERPEPINWTSLTAEDASPQTLLVRFDPDLAPAPTGGSGFRTLQTHQTLRATVRHEYRRIPWQLVEIPPDVSLAQAAAAYAEDPAVLDVEPNYIVHPMQTVPDDPEWGRLWGMQRIEAPIAWDVTTGSHDIIVAVIDTGVRYTHEDLSTNMWINPSPTFGDAHGAVWTSGTGVPTSGDPMDTHGHGTHVAGTIGAVGNNALGVVGVNWNVRLMALKFLDPSGWTADAIAAIEYAIDHGAHLSNNSWGGGGFSTALQQMIERARDANQLFIAAAGNNGSNNDVRAFYPANYAVDNVISVASIAENGALSGFSNFGANRVHIAAPGSGIYSAVATSDSAYAAYSGTSMAAPHVAGAAALLLSLQPDAEYGEVRDAILQSAQPNPNLTGRVASDGELNLPGVLTGAPGVLRLDRMAYRSGAIVEIRLVERELDPDVDFSVDVEWRTIDGNNAVRAQGTETLWREPDPDYLFLGQLQLMTDTPLGAGNALHGDVLEVTYTDTEGNLVVATAPIDDIPPEVLNLRIDERLDDRLVLAFDTDEPAIGAVMADTVVPPVEHEVAWTLFETNHLAAFDGLTPLTRYYLSLWVEDPAGNRTSIPVNPNSPNPADYLSDVTRSRLTVYETDFERGTEGWTTQTLYGEDCWEYGTPGVGPTPVSRCWGTRINGRYPASTHAVLTSPPIRVGAYPRIYFRQWRDMLHVSEFEDGGMIEVFKDGGWYNVTRYLADISVEDLITGRGFVWENKVVRLPETFAHQMLRFRFRFQSSAVLANNKPLGWYIDAFAVSELCESGVFLADVAIDDAPPGGDGDSFVEPGETITVQFTIFNLEDIALTNLVGRLTLLSAGGAAGQATLVNGSPALIDYGTVAAGDPAIGQPVDGQPLTIAISPDFEPGANLMLMQTLSDSQGRTYELTHALTIEPRETLSGWVLDAEDNPIDNVLVTARYGATTLSDVTDVDGAFVLDGAMLNRPYEVSLEPPAPFLPQSRRAFAPDTNLVFRLFAPIQPAIDPDFIWWQLVQGQSAAGTMTITNSHPDRSYVYRIETDLWGGNDGWLRLDRRGGTVPPGGSDILNLSVDTRTLHSGAYDAFLWFVDQSTDGGVMTATVLLDVLERPLLTFDSIRIDTPGGRMTAGVPADVWVTLKNTNVWSDATSTTGRVFSVDQATVTPDGTSWEFIPAGGTAEADTPLNVTLDPMGDGDAATITLEVVDSAGQTNLIAFSILNHAAYALDGHVTCEFRPDNNNVPPSPFVEPVSNAVVTVTDRHGAIVGSALTDTNGYYRIAALGGEPLWVAVQPPQYAPRMVPPPGAPLNLSGDLTLDFQFHQDGGDPPADHAPRLILHDVQVLDRETGDPVETIQPGDALTIRPRLRNIGIASATAVTGRLDAVTMAYPGAMTVASAAATVPVTITADTSPLHPVALGTPFEVEVDANAPRGHIQRFALTAVDVGTDPARAWPLEFALQVDTNVTLSGSVNFEIPADNTPENRQQVRLRLEMGAYQRTLGVNADGTFRFPQVPTETQGMLTVMEVPDGYRSPAPIPVPALTDDFDLGVIQILLPSLQFLDLDPSALAFSLVEGHAATGSVTVANTGAAPMTLHTSIRYQRKLGEVSEPEPEAPPRLEGFAEPTRPPLDWTHLEPDDYQADELVVRFEHGVSRTEQREILAAQGLEPVFYFNSFPAALARRLAGPAPMGMLAAMAETLEQDTRVTMVAPDARAEPMSTRVPDDGLFDQLWGLHNQRQTGGTLGADIRAPQAWSRTIGSREIIVAVADTGIDVTHPDLAANIWRNPYPGAAQFPDEPEIVNDFHGWNFYDWNNDVRDFDGHGTHVAGTIGAVGNNRFGVVGVNWQVSLMVLRLTGPPSFFGAPFTTAARIAKAIEYAVENGAHVSNHSWGGPDTAGVMHDAIAFAREHNHLVIAAAGNSGKNLDKLRTYPAYYSTVFDNVITVAASDHDGELANFTNFGDDSVHLAAPGVDVLSTIPSGILGGRYDSLSGTSMAAPHVAGVAGLLWSLSPDAPYTVIREAMLQGARPDTRLDGWVETGAHLDAWGAIRAMGAEWLQLPDVSASFTLPPGGSTNLTVVVNDPPVLTHRATAYAAEIRFASVDGAFRSALPVTAQVDAGVWLEVTHQRVERLAPNADALPPSPGDEIDLWLTLKNLGSATAGQLTGMLSGGAGSTLLISTNSWRDLYSGQSAESRNALRVTLDPAAVDDLNFEIEVFRAGVSAGQFLVTLPVLPGHAVTGRVVGRHSGAPLAGARVEVWGDQGATGLTRADGTFRLRGLPDGDFRLRVIPATHERSAVIDFAVNGADVGLGDIEVASPDVTFSSESIEVALTAGLVATQTLQIANLLGADAHAFAFTAYVTPRRRVALISDGATLQPLKAPLSAMGLDVTHFVDNFVRTNLFSPFSNRHEVSQQVRYTRDPALLAGYDAVVFDSTGPDGQGRVFSGAETATLRDFANRGGKVIFTGANPLSFPDNDALAGLMGVDGLDRATDASNQMTVVDAAWVNSPFLTLTNDQRLVSTALAHDLAPVGATAGVRALFGDGEANKLVYRPYGASGAFYLWTGNPDDADWAEQGLWQDVVRGILWRELLADAAREVAWLRTPTTQAVVPVGDTLPLELVFDSRWPITTGEHKAMLVMVGNYAGDDVRALPVTMTLRAPMFRAYTTGRVTDWRDQRLQGDGGPGSAVYQLLWAGPDGVVEPPALDGSPTGDDVLLGVFISRMPFGRIGVGHEHTFDSGRFNQSFRQTIPAGVASSNVYVRAWDGTSFETSLAYGDSTRFTIDPLETEEQDFGSWTVDQVLRYGRDSSGDSIPDGWLIENNPDVDPRAPVAPLPYRADFAGKAGFPAGTHVYTPHQVVVSENFMFVLDRDNYQRIFVLDRQPPHAVVAEFGAPGDGNGQFRKPEGLALDPRPGVHRLVVADTQKDRIQILAFNPDTGAITWQQTVGNGRGAAHNQFDRPAGVSVSPVTGDIFVADTQNNRVQILDAAGTFIHHFSGSGNFLMHNPQGIAVDYDLGVFVADTGTTTGPDGHRVLRFTHAGSPILKFGSQGTGDGQFSMPVDVRVWHQARPAVVGGGMVRRIAVAERTWGGRVQLFRPDGTHLGNVGLQDGSGQIDGRLSLPGGTFPVPDSRRIYVADTGNKRIQWFDVWLDADGDGMDDFWEDWNGLDSTRDDAFEDPDGDGLLNIGEFRANTDPWDPDSTGNGVGDLWELYQDGFPGGPALFVSLTADPDFVDAGTNVLLTATFDRAMPSDAEVWLTLDGSSPLEAQRMQTADGTIFVYQHATLLTESGWADGNVFCGYVDPPNNSSNFLFWIEAGGPPEPLPPFPIRLLTIGGTPLQITIGWEAEIGGEYRILRSQDLTLPTEDWDEIWRGFAGTDPMAHTLPLTLPFAYYKVERLQ